MEAKERLIKILVDSSMIRAGISYVGLEYLANNILKEFGSKEEYLEVMEQRDRANLLLGQKINLQCDKCIKK